MRNTAVRVFGIMLIQVVAACSGPTGPSAITYNGNFSATRVDSSSSTAFGGSATCTWNASDVGTLSIKLTQNSDGTVSGTANATETITQVGPTIVVGGPGATCPNESTQNNTWKADVSGTTANLTFSVQQSAPAEGSGTIVNTMAFTGTLSGGAITGTLTHNMSGSGTIGAGTVTHSGSMTTSITLR